jgi:hypothetical protein
MDDGAYVHDEELPDADGAYVDPWEEFQRRLAVLRERERQQGQAQEQEQQQQQQREEAGDGSMSEAAAVPAQVQDRLQLLLQRQQDEAACLVRPSSGAGATLPAAGLELQQGAGEPGWQGGREGGKRQRPGQGLGASTNFQHRLAVLMARHPEEQQPMPEPEERQPMPEPEERQPMPEPEEQQPMPEPDYSKPEPEGLLGASTPAGLAFQQRLLVLQQRQPLGGLRSNPAGEAGACGQSAEQQQQQQHEQQLEATCRLASPPCSKT